MTHKPVHCHSDKSPCPLAHALDILGDRWTLLVVRDMLFKNKHEYKEFLESHEGIATNILVNRLKRLQQAKIVASQPHPDDKKRKFYYLTPTGKALAEPIMATICWSHLHLPSVNLPPALARRVEKEPKKIISDALKVLNAWEKRHIRP